MKNNKTALVLVIDAVGLSTFKYLFGKYGKKTALKNLAALGLGEIIGKENSKYLPGKYAGRALPLSVDQVSATADSLIGHREMMGVIDNRTYELFYDGFPKDYLSALEKAVGRKTFFNKMAGGVEAIEQNAQRHEKTGELIVYASKCDPLIQIAMNEDIIPVKEQHYIADTAFKIGREMGLPITRCIARSYVKRNGEIIRTSNRHDAVLPIGQKTLVDIMNEKHIWTVAVGKTSDLVNTHYNARIKLTNKVFLDPALKLRFVHPKQKDTNPFTIQGTINSLNAKKVVYRPMGTFIFTNLVDTDSLYGHTRDVAGAIKSLEEIDRNLPLIINAMDKGDLLVITADHGMEHRDDYGYHNNEPLPFISYRKGFDRKLGGLKTGKMPGLTDIGNLLAQFFSIEREYSSIVKR
ncbi:MAG: phosphopentomutase [Elusimicrobiota bacterium]